ncbi:UDP-glucose 4-epimerase GalE [Cytobacillus firmus]|uniref:UDP-glucose 4-epimerase GalE n=1 Tax=Cytobacillus firmus TaxID=1399 RepID=UPI0021C9E592|nr:UDP-glucose 4-epimerase GalE [Cytobacillus firmus]MCU1807087.1 UDP-glucose 4-epimerase GalE [Cytobacillus firmus]
MAILVTGGAGYIGSHTCIELLNAGHEIIVVDNFHNSKPDVLKRIRKITQRDFISKEIDIQDKDELEKVFIDHSIEAVIHFAGLKAVGESVQNPLRYYETNVNGTLVLCNLMAKYDVKRMVFSSSATVYGNPDQVPITEDSPLRATNPYGWSKLMVEQILTDLAASDKEWSISSLRYFNPIGAHASGEIGEDPQGIPNNLMPFITQVAIGKMNQLKVFGGDYDTSDGTGVRDYIHVVDLAQGHLRALEKIQKISGFHAYNLGTGKGYSVLEIKEAFEEAAGMKIPYSIVERRPGDIAVCYADPAKAKEELNWEAAKGIKEMCADAWRWQRKSFKG